MDDFAPKLHKILQAEGKRFATYAVKKMQRLGKDANDPADPNNANADAILGAYTSPTFTADLTDALSAFIVQVYVSGMTDAYSQITPGFEVDQQFHAYAEAYAQQQTANLVTGISDSTKKMLRGDLINMMNQGLSPYDMVQQLEADYAFSDKRAFVIARTETGFAWNDAALTSYGLAGMGLVYVYDGDYDPDCQDADGEVWTVEYAKEHLLEHPNCLAEGTLVMANNIEASFTRGYEGEVIVLRTARDNEITVTPNHPILTVNGWKAAGVLREGDKVICDISNDWASGCSDHDDMIAVVEEVAKSLPVVLNVMPTSTEHFHGDGTDGEVCIIRANSLLSDGNKSTVNQHGTQKLLVRADVLAGVGGVSSKTFQTDGVVDLPVERLLTTTDGVVGGIDNGGTFINGHSVVTQLEGIGLFTDDTKITQPSTNGSGTVDTKHFSDGIRRQTLSDVEIEKLAVSGAISGCPSAGWQESQTSVLETASDDVATNATSISKDMGTLASQIAAVEIVNVERQFYSGHVYNLQTEQGWYVANSIITHNCVRSFGPCLDDVEPDRGGEGYVEPEKSKGKGRKK